MAKPVILTVDDDPAVSQAITRDLRRQYGAEYQIVRAAERHHGRITIDSSSDGTELCVRLPLPRTDSGQFSPEKRARDLT